MVRPPIMKKSRLGNSTDEGIQAILFPFVLFLLSYVFISPKIHTYLAPIFNIFVLILLVCCFKTSTINKGKHGVVRVLIALKYYMRKAVNKWHGI